MNLFREPSHLLILLVLVALLFGWRKLPDIARSVGRSMRIFKSEVTEMKNDSKDDKPSDKAADETSSDTVSGTVVPPRREDGTPT